MSPKEQMVPAEDERTLAALAHASILLSVISLGILGPVASFFIWIVKRRDSEFVDDQALQAFLYQTLLLVLMGGYWVLTIALSFILIGLCLIPIGLLLSLLTLAYGLWAAYETYYGRPFRYVVVTEIAQSLRASLASRS